MPDPRRGRGNPYVERRRAKMRALGYDPDDEIDREHYYSKRWPRYEAGEDNEETTDAD